MAKKDNMGFFLGGGNVVVGISIYNYSLCLIKLPLILFLFYLIRNFKKIKKILKRWSNLELVAVLASISLGTQTQRCLANMFGI